MNEPEGTEPRHKILMYGLIAVGVVVVVIILRSSAGSSGGTILGGGGNSGGTTGTSTTTTDYSGQLSYQQGLADIANNTAFQAEGLQKDLLGAETAAQISINSGNTANAISIANTNTANSISVSNANAANSNSIATIQEQLQAALAGTNAQINANQSAADVTNALALAKGQADVSNATDLTKINDLIYGQKALDSEANKQSANATNTLVQNLINLAKGLQTPSGNGRDDVASELRNSGFFELPGNSNAYATLTPGQINLTAELDSLLGIGGNSN